MTAPPVGATVRTGKVCASYRASDGFSSEERFELDAVRFDADKLFRGSFAGGRRWRLQARGRRR
jgi:hypothetical protein